MEIFKMIAFVGLISVFSTSCARQSHMGCPAHITAAPEKMETTTAFTVIPDKQAETIDAF